MMSGGRVMVAGCRLPKRRRAFAVVMLAFAFAFPSTVQPTVAGDDGWAHKRYDSGGVIGRLIAVPDGAGVTDDGTIDIGGAQFEALDGAGRGFVDIRVVDDTSDYIAVEVCQDIGLTQPQCARATPTGLICHPSGETRSFAVRRGYPITVHVWRVAVCASVNYLLLPVFHGIATSTSGTISLREHVE